MSEAIDVALAGLNDELERTLTEAQTFPEAIGLILAPWRRVLVDHEFALGCPLAATVVDAAKNDELRAHVSDVLDRWQSAVADIYTKFGSSPAVADEHATVLLAALEGALILARAHRSTAPLDTVERYFAAGAPSTPIGVLRPAPDGGRCYIAAKAPELAAQLATAQSATPGSL
jgi:transcriptional regulator LmrA/YxaF-like protein